MLIFLSKSLLYFDKLLITNNYLSFNNKFKLLLRSTRNFSNLSIVNFVL